MGATFWIGPGWVFHWSTEDGFQMTKAEHNTWRLGILFAFRNKVK